MAAIVVLFLAGVLGALFVYWIHAPAPALPALAGKAVRGTMTIDGMERRWLCYTPPNMGPGAPLLLVLHGTYQDGEKIRIGTGYGFDRLADRAGFMVVYPDGYKGSWNDCRKGSDTPAKQADLNDTAFLSELVERMRVDAGIDPARVFAMGFSNGGQMGLRLLAERPAMLAGLALVGANLPTPDCSLCNWSKAVPLLMVHGTEDAIVPYQGGQVSLFGRKRGHVLSSQDTALAFARLAGADAASAHALTTTPADPRLPVDLQTWSRDGHVQVALYTVRGGGHVVPQPGFRYPRLLGPTSRGLDTPAVVAGFFGLSA